MSGSTNEAHPHVCLVLSPLAWGRALDHSITQIRKVAVVKVYKAINAVQAELAKSGISKDSTNTFDNYKFRGIDAVYNALSPLLAKHGLCILPRILTRASVERETAKGGAIFYVTVEAEFDFVSAEDGSKHTVRTFGEAMDRGDKATNKAMSAAYKYAAFQAFAIPTEGDNDADAQTHEVKSVRVSAPEEVFRNMQPELQDYCRTMARKIVEQMPNMSRIMDILALEGMDNEAKIGVWSLLDSKTRSAIKKAQEEIK
jgi:hypothetical protein